MLVDVVVILMHSLVTMIVFRHWSLLVQLWRMR